MEKPEAFKNWINEEVVKKLSQSIICHFPLFQEQKFNLLSSQLKNYELKGRVLLITENLKQYLPEKYPEALAILVKVIEEKKLKSFELWPFSEYIGQFGHYHFEKSMKAMYLLTQNFTSEFAIRPFFLKDHKRVLEYFHKWSKDKNVHVRRWVSEGSRPLLPWGERLPLFVKDPTHTLPLLENLKYDEELYVRKSVANHLNDISKHHPLIVIKTLKQWEKNCELNHQDKIEWIKHRALRTLIKKGHLGALKLVGVNQNTKLSLLKFLLVSKDLEVGDYLKFNLGIQSKSSKKQKLVIDYILHFKRANGSMGHKVFKLKVLELKPMEKINLEKSHQLKEITTMKFYPGEQSISLQVNGKILKRLKFKLEI